MVFSVVSSGRVMLLAYWIRWQSRGSETRRMELAQRRALTRHIALRLGIVVVVLGGGGLVFLQLPALTGLGAILLSLAVLCLPLAVLCLVAALAVQPAERLPRWFLLVGAVGGVLALTALLIEPQPWLMITLAVAVWLLVVGTIAATALAILR